MKFRVLVGNDDKYAMKIANHLGRRGCDVFDVRYADIVTNDTNEKTGDTKILCAKGSWLAWRKIVREAKKDGCRIFDYEGFKTIG